MKACSVMHCPGLPLGGSKEIVRPSACTGMFMNRFNGLGVNGGALRPVDCSTTVKSVVLLPSLSNHLYSHL